MFSFDKTYKLPFKHNIPNYIELHLREVNLFKRFMKYFKRYLYILLKSQKNLEIPAILSNHKKILWINVSAPSIGDSLMDLSSRIMLIDKNIDLFTDIKNSHIYVDDQIFKNIYTKVKDIDKFKYDLVILDSYSTRSIRIKSKITPKASYVGMFGFFNGPEINRTLFSFHKMNKLLGYTKDESEINAMSRTIISISEKDKELVSDIIPEKYIAFVLGGEWKYKTYSKWSEVINKIITENNKINIVLIGSENAKIVSNELLRDFSQNNFFNFVAKLSFNQTVEVIRRSEVLLCCDGGLMHAANAVSTNVVSLLARLSAEMLLTKNCISLNLHDDNDVNNISVTDVLEKYHQAHAFVD